MNNEIQKTALRIPKKLHQKILETAKISGRSMNAEIVNRLEESFKSHTVSLNFNEQEIKYIKMMVAREAKLLLDEDEKRDKKKLTEKP